MVTKTPCSTHLRLTTRDPETAFSVKKGITRPATSISTSSTMSSMK